MPKTAQIVICGAGIAGVSAAYYLSKAGVKDILLIDERPPLSLTSDRSTECYRNWWPDPEMLALMNRSIDLMEELAEETGNAFHMNRRGYLYVTADQSKIPVLIERAKRTSNLGAGPLRVHTAESSTYQPAPLEGFHDQPSGADLLLSETLLRRHFPYLTRNATAALHVRRAGWLSAQQMGMTLLEAGRKNGVRFESGKVTGIKTENGQVQGVRLATGDTIHTKVFINAAGPFLKDVGVLLGLELPVHTELHLKVAFNDPLGAVDRSAPLLIWDDTQFLPWNAEENQALAEDPETCWLTEPFPAGAHTRPEGSGNSQTILLLWEYKTKSMPPTWPPPMEDLYPEIALRGMSTMIPALSGYFDRMPRPQLDGGYYTKTKENRPLIGALPIQGAYVIGALSGYGIMSACGAGDLLARQISGQSLPAYAAAVELSRYNDPAYLEKIDTWTDEGQL